MERYRTFLPRLIALLIDNFIMLPLGIMDDWFRQAEFAPVFFYFWIPLSALVLPVYMILMHGFYGQTLGKMWMNVKVLNAATEEPIKFNQAFLREAPQLVFNLAGIYLAIAFFGVDPATDAVKSPYSIFVTVAAAWVFADIVTCLYSPKRRALHDFIAGTVVVKLDK